MRFEDESDKLLHNPTNGTSSGLSDGAETLPNGVSANGGSSLRNGKMKAQNESSGTVNNGQLAPNYFGHDREEVTRLIIQSLYDLGYGSSARQLEAESNYQLESGEATSFRDAVEKGQWSKVEALLDVLELHEDADKNALLFQLRQQKYLELLEVGLLGNALQVLRTELTPLDHDRDQLHFLSSLMMFSPEDVLIRAGWDGANGTSRKQLLNSLSSAISPSVIIPEHRLATLLQQVKGTQISNCLYHNSNSSPSLYTDHKCDRNQFPSQTIMVLEDHTNEVWTVAFSHDGLRLATGSKDGTAIIYDVRTWSIIHTLKEHTQGVAYVSWSPDDTYIVTCSNDRTARLWDAKSGKCLKVLEKQTEPVTCCSWAPDGKAFATGSVDKSIVLWNLNGEDLHTWQGSRIYDIVITPDGTRLISICTEQKIHVYDLTSPKKDEFFQLSMKAPLTSISVTKDSRYAIVNLGQGSEQIQMIDLDLNEEVRAFKGHKQGKFVIKSCFGGADENFVVSGSEDCMIYVWHKENGMLMESLPGHDGTVNCVTWNPTNPQMFASAGDDKVVRIWSVPNDSLKGKEREREMFDEMIEE
ncbi:Beta-TrCP [Orbilia brochopaga]|nr:Beta-TrCP [Drechslerella brochopaga]